MTSIRLADPAATALDGPGSTAVSCLLMEDTVSADAVSVGPGAGQVGLFANPFLGGRREAVVVDENGFLTYLRRDASGTGWAQARLSGAGGPLAATEVVVVVHPQRLDVWAVYNPKAGGTPRALRLTGPAGDESPCTWQEVPGAVTVLNGKQVNGLARMNVYYHGRQPVISAMDTRTGDLVTVWAKTGAGNGVFFGCLVPGRPLNAAGAQEVLGGVESGNNSVWFARTGSKLVRYSQSSTTPTLVASDAAKLVGVFGSPYDQQLGCVYLDGGGKLVTWQFSPGSSGGVLTTNTVGLGFWTAATWLDGNGMMHVYGRVKSTEPGGHDTLKVVHQIAWSSGYAAPIWAQVTPGTGAARVRAGTVTACVGLVPDVEYVDLDPYPGEAPAMLVELAGPAADPERFSIHSLDQAAQRWSRDKIRLPSGGSPRLVSRYISSVTVLDRRGAPMPGLPVSVSADVLVEVTVEGVGHLIGPGHPVRLTTDAFGRITMATAADSLLPATLRVDAAGLEHGAVVQPANAVHEYLAGTGTLGSQQGLFDGPALWNATVGGVPIVDRGKHDEHACDAVADHTAQLFLVAAGKTPVSRRHTEAGPAPVIHGFALGSALSPLTGHDAGRVRYTEYATAGEFQAALTAVEARAGFAGTWEDFTDWAGDLWEGIKNGVVTVTHVFIDTAATLALKIGDAVVWLRDLAIGTVEAAVRICEAVLSQVVQATAEVVDWLKALFKFEDIWHTAQALQSGLETMLDYGTQTIKHFRTVGGAWFLTQGPAVTDAFTKLRAGWAGMQAGEPGNETPALDDHSQHAIVPRTLRDDPQATWMLDRTIASGIAPGQLPPDKNLSDAWDNFATCVEGTDYAKHFQAIQKDLASLLARVTDPGDPQQAAKASAIALLDILENLIDLALKAMSAAFDTGVALVLDALSYAGSVLAFPLPAGPLNDLYRWIQGEGGVAADDVKDLTIGGLVFLIAGFAVTTAYKLVNGVDQAPFPGGVFPAVAGPVWGPEAGPGAGTVSDPDPAELRRVKGAMGVIGIAASVFNAFADISPAAPIPPRLAFTAWLVPTANCLLGSTTELVLSCPSINGKQWKGGAAGAFAMSSVQAALSFGTLGIFLAKNADDRKRFTGAFKNIGLVAPINPTGMVPLWGPLAVTALTAATLTCTLVESLPPNPYAWGQLFLASTPGLTQWARVGIFKPDDSGWSLLRAGTVGAIDGAAGMTAGLMTACAGLMPGLDIPQQVVRQAVRDTKYDYTVARTGEYAFNTPLKWEIVAGKLPDGLKLHETTGIISGIPTANATTPEFTVRCTDSYSPPQVVSRTGFKIVVSD